MRISVDRWEAGLQGERYKFLLDRPIFSLIRTSTEQFTMGQLLSSLLDIFYTKKLDIVVIGLENRCVSLGDGSVFDWL